jgi:hypothetical protein
MAATAATSPAADSELVTVYSHPRANPHASSRYAWAKTTKDPSTGSQTTISPMALKVDQTRRAEME